MRIIKKHKWHSLSDAPKNVPILDFEALKSTAKDRSLFQNTLSRSGLFYLKNFGIDESLLLELNRQTLSFFHRDEMEKKKMICDELPLRGYASLKSENLARLESVGDYPDLCMKYSWQSKDNVYPNDEFQKIWQTYYGQINGLGRDLLRLISKVLPHQKCDDKDWDLIIHGGSTLRYLYYPDLDDDQELSMAPHSDLGSLTILYQTPAPNGHVALEAVVDGEFVPIPAIAGTLVVNLGDILAHVTENQVRATKHRIVHTPLPGGQRTSTICFFLPDRELNLRKFSGGRFCNLLTDEISTFGELIDKNGRDYR